MSGIAGVELTGPEASRFLLNLSFKLPGQEWIAYNTIQPRSGDARWVKFVESCTPEELELFSVPPPGHEFWTHDMVDAMAVRYPGLDVEPYRRRTTSQPAQAGREPSGRGRAPS